MLSEILTRDSAAAILASMDDFLEYVKQRKTALRRELAALESAERIYLQSGSAGGRQLVLPTTGQPPKPTIKKGVIQLLQEAHPMGLTALEILDRLNNRWWGGKLRRTSLSPQITRLKKLGKLFNERGTWKLRNENAPSEVSNGAS